MASEPSSPAKPGLATRAARRVLTISLTLATVAGAIGLVYLASGWIAANAARGDGQEEVRAAAVPVETQVLKLQAGYETEVEVLGRIEAGSAGERLADGRHGEELRRRLAQRAARGLSHGGPDARDDDGIAHDGRHS